LNPQAGQRQTACIRNISAWPHRSQIIVSLSHAACDRGAGPGGGEGGFDGSGMLGL